MNNNFRKIILTSTGATELTEIEKIQSLWSGYGEISRYGLKGSRINTVIIKHVKLPQLTANFRKKESDLSHHRKIKSYQVEAAWYKEWAKECSNNCRIPLCYAQKSENNELLIVLEDLDDAGYPGRKNRLSINEIIICLEWLAEFHSIFMNREPVNLWKNGTYWHLDTRPDELKVLDDIKLKKAAAAIDLKLKKSNFKTIVHGDAKLENFCFSGNGNEVAAVDFQYTGGGCGMKDVAYFIGSCMNDEVCGKMERELLNFYFSALTESLKIHQPQIDFHAVEKEWRELYHFAWADFHRFIKGWTSVNFKPDSYSETITRNVIKKLNEESPYV